MRPLYLILVFILLLCFCVPAFSQSETHLPDEPIYRTGDFRFGSVEEPAMEAVRLQPGETIEIDGFLMEEAWHRAPVATGFTQRMPNDGEPATEKTEVRILYDDEAVYIGITAYDSAPDSILAPLFRRDGNQPSDWVYVSFDSYGDNRTAFTFAVNPRGVQKDVLYYDDRHEDVQWNAVWEAETSINAEGWAVEMRVPLSQLRYSSSNGEQYWGVNFQRRIARHGEISFWAPTSQSSNRLVSRFGTLTGINNLESPRRLEITPYSAANLVQAPDPGDGNPLYERNSFEGKIGGDLRYGLSTDLTLTMTVNPDFGQVEADPAVINLTAHETFFDEQRPFFLEGNEIFQFGRTQSFNYFGNTMPFYSRRIGQSPQGRPDLAGIDADHFEAPDYTRIASAVKLSGKTGSGWSVGILDAFTLEETAPVILQDGVQQKLAVEPASNYLVSRLRKDFNEGDSYLGGFGTAVNRRVDGTYFESFLRSSAYQLGGDLEHNFGNGEWVASGYFVLSTIQGSTEAIERAQTSPVRYFNRVDSDHLSVDPEKTRLSGYSTEFSIQKRGGDRWLGSLTYNESSPGYEANDIGFQTRTNYRTINSALIYRNPSPDRLQYYEFWLAQVRGWNFDGDKISRFQGGGGFIRFRNLWSINFAVNYNPQRADDRLTRGGPIMMRPSDQSFNINLNSNPNRSLSLHTGMFHSKNGEGGYNHNFWGGINTQPVPWLQLGISPRISFSNNVFQYITTVSDPEASDTFGYRYIFSDVEQVTYSTTMRVDWTFSPTLSLQTYLRPFISSGKFSNFKELAEPSTHNFNRFGEDLGDIVKTDGIYIIDPDGSGESLITFADPDFNFRSIQGNAVLRWEYRPGSTLFFVWQQQRQHSVNRGAFDFSGDMRELLSASPTNVFLVKASFWLGS